MSGISTISTGRADLIRFLLDHPDSYNFLSTANIRNLRNVIQAQTSPPTTLPNTFKIIYRWQGPTGLIAENVWWMRSAAYTGIQTQVNAIGTQLAGVEVGTGNLKQLVHPDWQLESVIVQDNHGTGNFNQTLVNLPGTDPGAGPTMPPNVAAAISWDWERKRKGGKPRTYIPGISSTNVSTPGGSLWTSAFTLLLRTAGESFRTTVQGLVSNAVAGAVLGTLSRMENHAWLAVPQFWPYYGTKSHDRIDTQRRRLGKEITSG